MFEIIQRKKLLHGFFGDVQSVKGNTIIYHGFANLTATGYTELNFKLRAKGKNKLVRTSKMVPLKHEKKPAQSSRIELVYHTGYRKLETNVKIYKNATSASASHVFKKGTLMKVTHFYFSKRYQRFRIVTKKGTVGWINISAHSMRSGYPAPIFKNVRYFL